MRKLIVLCSLLTIAFSSCDDTVAVSMRTELLTKGKWQKYAEYVVVGGTTQDLFAPLQPCVQDNLYFFGLDKSYGIDEFDVKCNSNDPQTVNAGSWEFLNADTQIKLNVSSTSTVWNIQKMSDTAMIFTITNAGSVLTQRYRHTN